MKLFNYDELVRVIGNVEDREERERNNDLINLKEKYKTLKRTLIESGILDDWSRLKQLCAKANVRLCVSHQGKLSMGCVINHPEDFKYCKEYKDNGTFRECMSSGSSWSDYFGFFYTTETGFNWNIVHTSSYHGFEWFKTEEDEYNTKIRLLETFKNTYENYRSFQLKKIEKKFENRIKTEDILK